MLMKWSSYWCVAFLMMMSCHLPNNEQKRGSKQPQTSATGDSVAIALASEVILSSGGLKAWESIPTITWNFFGRRKLLWDKHNQLVRIDFVGRPLKMWVDLKHDTIGQVWLDNHFLAGDSLQDFLKRTKSIWINDSYWLSFPFKLLDKGVDLTMAETDTNMLGESSQTFWMTFENVGDTPNNKYKVYVSDSSHLVNQWDFYKDSLSTTPDLATTFESYNEFAGVLLSQKRSGFTLSDIQTFQSFDADSLKDLSVEVFW
jgi:plasmid maintenance system killer protein